jgi:hypothetical protein
MQWNMFPTGFCYHALNCSGRRSGVRVLYHAPDLRPGRLAAASHAPHLLEGEPQLSQGTAGSCRLNSGTVLALLR